jgi:hypothetical protein
VLRRAVVPFLLFVILPSVFTYPLCGWIFRCGCVSVWAGAADHCNIHLTRDFHCPWCEHVGLGALAFVLMIAGQALAFALLRRRGRSAWTSTLGAIAALPLAALLAGALTFLLTDYPHFLVQDARKRFGLPPGPIRTRALMLGFTHAGGDDAGPRGHERL